jgi:hypothetical protein
MASATSLLGGLFAVAFTVSCGTGIFTAPFVPDLFPSDSTKSIDAAALAPVTRLWHTQHGK